MSITRIRRLGRRALALAFPLALLGSLAGAAGPPWITIEYPANPLDAETRGALVVVRTYHHEAPQVADMTAEATAIIDGRRVTRPLGVTTTSRDGVYAVRGELPGDVAWVIEVTSRRGTQGATALVAIGEGGELLAVRVPHDTREGGRWMVPRSPTEAEFEELLRTASAMDDAARSTRPAAGAGAALLLLVLAPSGAWLARRRQPR